MGKRKKNSHDHVVSTRNDVNITAPLFNKFIMKLSEHKIVVAIFILCFIIYNTYTLIRMSGDTIPAAYLPFNIIYYHDLFFEHFFVQDAINTHYFFTNVNGHLLSIFPIVTPIVITPFVYVCSVGMSPDQVSLFVGQIARTASAGITALAVCVFYLIVKRFVSKKISIFSALLFAFATSTWSISSQALWQQGMVELLLLLMIYIIIKNEEAGSPRYFICLGVLSGLFVFCRPPDAILLLPILGYILLRNFKYTLPYAAAAIVSGLPFLIYNLYFFGNLFGGYVQNLQKFDVSGSVFFNFLGLLVSPNKGLFIFSPILILGIFGFFYLNTIHNSNIKLLFQWFAPTLILQIIIYAFFSDWGGGYSYGPRFLTSLMPLLCIYLALFLSEFEAHFSTGIFAYAKLAGVILLVIFSIAIQFIGVFYFPYLYDTNYSQPWDLSKPVIINSLHDGMTQIDTFVVQSIPPLPPFFYYSRSDTQSIQHAIYARNHGDYETAVKYYKKSLQTDSDTYIVWNDLGSCQMKVGQYEDALQSYDRALAINPEDSNVWYNKATVLASLHRFNESRDAYATATRLKTPAV